MNSKPIFRVALLSVACAAAFGVAAPQQANAVTYYENQVYESWGSTANISVNAQGAWTPWKKMQPNTFSYGWPTFIKSVKCFFVPAGYVAVNTATKYGYRSGESGKSYCFTQSWVKISLLVESNYCWFLRSMMKTPCKIYPPTAPEALTAVTNDSLV